MAYNRVKFDNGVTCFVRVPLLLGPTLKTDYPEIVRTARISNVSFLFAGDDAKFKMKTGYIDSDFLTMFDFPLLFGNTETALNDPYSVILTEKAAMRFFGREDPMGKTLLLENAVSMTVTGVMKDLPGNSLFQFEALVPFLLLKTTGPYIDDWRSNRIETYVELQPNARLDLVNESIRGMIKTKLNNTVESELFLFPVNKIHLYSKFENGMPVKGELTQKMRLFGVITGLILLVACINFTNLCTARYSKRAKETGVRKALGGKRQSLIRLFLAESMTVSFIAGATALIFAWMALPVFRTLMGNQIILDLTHAGFWLTGLGFVIFTGLLAGSYPAFYLSAFLPVKVLKGVFSVADRRLTLRKVLVTLQFTVASALIMATWVIHRQISYAQDRETGYNKAHLIYIPFSGDIRNNYELIKQDLLNSGTAISVTKTNTPMTQSWDNIGINNLDWRGKDPNARDMVFAMFFTDADLTKTIGTTIIEGRDIDIHTYATDSTALILNESAVKIMNFDNPVGEIVAFIDKDWHVVGVVKDFILESPYKPVAPMVIGGFNGWSTIMHIKLNGQNRMADNLAQAKQIFNQYNPAYPFEYNFIDEEYARKFRNEVKMGTMLTWFAGLAIFICCLGLFALVAYMAETRRKEIGIRKVLGASVSDITSLLSKEFLILVLISIAVASPVAWWAMEKWLTNYAYRINIPWWLFVVVGCISTGIALLTVGFQAIKAATANPVEAIKSE